MGPPLFCCEGPRGGGGKRPLRSKSFDGHTESAGEFSQSNNGNVAAADFNIGEEAILVCHLALCRRACATFLTWRRLRDMKTATKGFFLKT